MTDYATPAQIMAAMNTDLDPATEPGFYQQLLDLGAGASRLIEKSCFRRFDRRIATLNHDARQSEDGGDVVGKLLQLRDDLISLTTLVNDDTTLTPTDYLLLPDNATEKNQIQLTQDVTGWLWSGRPYDAIQVSGVWGYGGRWKFNGVLTADMGAGDLVMSVNAPTSFEHRQTISIQDEYLTIDAPVSGNPIAVERAVNGATAAAHLTGVPVYLFVPDPLVTRLCTRLARWMDALDDNPLVATVTVGDFQQPIDLTQAPKDIQDMIVLLKRKERIGAA